MMSKDLRLDDATEVDDNSSLIGVDDLALGLADALEILILSIRC